jgi:hypothetical protein
MDEKNFIFLSFVKGEENFISNDKNVTGKNSRLDSSHLQTMKEFCKITFTFSLLLLLLLLFIVVTPATLDIAGRLTPYFLDEGGVREMHSVPFCMTRLPD